MKNRSLSANLAFAAAVVLIGVLLTFAAARETPRGSLSGRVVLQESGLPISVDVYLSAVNPIRNEKSFFSTVSDADGAFSFRRVPAGDYVLEASAKAHSIKPVRIRVEEAKSNRIEVELIPSEPFLEMYVHQNVFTPDEMPQITCRGFVETGDVAVGLYKVNADSLLIKEGGDLRPLIYGRQNYYYNYRDRVVDLGSKESLEKVESIDAVINSRDKEGIFTQRIDLPRMPAGIYVTEVRAGGIQRLNWIMVTSLGLITKVAGSELLAYTVDLKTGVPVPDAEVAVYSRDKRVGEGRTGADGLLRLKIEGKLKDSYWLKTSARKGESTAVVETYAYDEEDYKDRIYSYTDRPVYRPGQTVHFKGIVRKPEGDGYKLPDPMPMNIEVRDPNDTLIFTGKKSTDSFGSYNGEFKLSKDSPTGWYTVTSWEKNRRSGDAVGFSVAEYSKPDITVKVEPEKKRYVRGETVKAKVKASYYFGAPAADAEVKVYIYRSDYWMFDYEDYDYYGYEDYGGYGEYVMSKEVRTNSRGEAEISFPAVWEQPKEDDSWDSDKQYSIEASVTDKSSKQASGDASVIVTRGEFSVDVSVDSYIIEPGDSVTAAIQAMDYERKPVAGQEIGVKAGYRDWKDSGELVFIPIGEQKVRTDEKGMADVKFQIDKSGSVEIIASTKDKRGNKIVSSSYLWSYSGAGQYAGTNRRKDLEIVTDKKSYFPGETAKVLINTNEPGATALLTIEGDRIYHVEKVKISSKTTMVTFPIKEAYKPNFFVSVCFVKDKEFASQIERLSVSLKNSSIDVTVKPDRENYGPGDDAVFNIKASGPNGKPAAAQLSVGVVDEAIYAIAEDSTPNITDYFYSEKSNLVDTGFSFPSIYLSDPDKAEGEAAKSELQVRTRKNFKDTAFWMADVVTDAKGEASVKFKMPDNLTTWRTTVRGITRDTLCGQAENKVVTSRDFIVRLDTPRFAVQKDVTKVGAIVHNYTDKDRDVTVDISAPDFMVEGNAEQRVFVKKGGIRRVEWNVGASKTGVLPISVKAVGGDVGDAMQLDIPVYAHGVEKVSLKTGGISGSGTEKFSLTVREDSIPETLELNLRLAPSVASALLGSLDYLARYPWGCTEQTTSSFLPDVVIYKAFDDLGIENEELKEQLPDMVYKGISRLYGFRHYDGGWSWSTYGDSDPWMTAYVCYALMQARDAGFPVNRYVISGGLSWLSGQVSMTKMDTRTKAFCVYVLSLAGYNTSEWLKQLENQWQPDSTSLAYLALSLEHTGNRDRAKQALDRLMSRGISESTFLHWKGSYGRAGDIETTALALQALVRIAPEDGRAVQIARWLMRERRGDRWYSTRDTAMTLYAMTEFLKVSKELSPSYDLAVVVNGKEVSEVHVDKSSLFKPEAEVSVSDLKKGRNDIEIRKIGEGSLYYSARLNQTVAMDEIPARVNGSGVSVTRSYYKPKPGYWGDSSEKNLGQQVSSCGKNDIIMVRLKVSSNTDLNHLMVEDFIPAGFEIIDRGEVSNWSWGNWWSGQDVRDEKTSFYVEKMYAGSHVIEYQMRAATPGSFHALPAQVFAMYDPDVTAASGEREFRVK